MAMKTWNKERKRTRDRLIEYDFNLVPPHPHSAGIPFIFPIESEGLNPLPPFGGNATSLPFVYPWEQIQIHMLERDIFIIAQNNGYEGTAEQLWQIFSRDGWVVKGTIDTFPLPGNPNNLYLDAETGILYYFKTSDTVNYENAESAGAVIHEIDANTFYLYIPVRALLIEDTILNCGDASEYIG